MKRADAAKVVAGVVSSLLPDVRYENILQIVEEVAPGNTVLKLQRYINSHPNFLSAGDGTAPIQVFRMLGRLEELRPGNVVVPRCADCGKRRNLTRVRRDGYRICQGCCLRRAADLCSSCGRTRPIITRRNGRALCGTCYAKDPSRFENCGKCGQLSRVAARLHDGSSTCERCYRRPRRLCIRCGELGETKAQTVDGPVCDRCYSRPERLCSRCGRIMQIAARSQGDQGDLCVSCYRGQVALCSVCGLEKPCKGVKKGRPICVTCSPKSPVPEVPCVECSRVRPVTIRWPIGPVCITCYKRVRGRPAACPVCQKIRPLIGITSASQRCCGPCAGVDLTYSCSNCDGCGDLYRRGECARCVLRRELNDYFDPSRNTQLSSLVSELETVENPRTVLFWLRYKQGGAHLLRELLRSGHQLSHELLDDFPRRQAATHVRHILVHVGALPARDENVARTEQWVDDFLREAEHHRAVIQPYALWVVLRRARRRAETRGLTRAGANYARALISNSATFLRWLDEEGIDLESVTQGQVERWISEGATSRYRIADFLNWAKRCHLCGDLSVPVRASGDPVNFHSEDDQVRLLMRCVKDVNLPIDVRAAGALVLLYGVPVSRISQLTLKHLEERSDGIYLTFGDYPVLMPPAIARLVMDQASRSPRSVVGRSDGTRWLFPGNLAGKAIGATPLARRLATHGIGVRAAKNTAVLSLASDLPAPVLSQILGVHINTAVHWVKYVKRDWASYVESRRHTAPRE